MKTACCKYWIIIEDNCDVSFAILWSSRGNEEEGWLDFTYPARWCAVIADDFTAIFEQGKHINVNDPIILQQDFKQNNFMAVLANTDGCFGKRLDLSCFIWIYYTKSIWATCNHFISVTLSRKKKRKMIILFYFVWMCTACAEEEKSSFPIMLPRWHD